MSAAPEPLDAWERRAREEGDSLRAVLFRNFPEVLNRHLHAWQVGAVLAGMPARPAPRVLDVGCGWGRLAEAVLAAHPRAELVGLDASPRFAALFRERTGQPAVVADLRRVPPDLGSFDAVICVTALMYLAPGEVAPCVAGLASRLRPGGRLILVENDRSGWGLLTAGGLVAAARSARAAPPPTGGRVLGGAEMRAALDAAGLRSCWERRLPATSAGILPLALVGHLAGEVARPVLRLAAWLDRWTAGLPLPSLYVARVAERGAGGC